MLRKVLALAAFASFAFAAPALAAPEPAEPLEVHWSFQGPFGMYDQAQLQRGYKVYREVCAACHSMNFIYFRNLGDPGGPFYNPEYPNPNDNPAVKAIAREFEIADIDSETGDPVKRPGTPADRFPNPFPNAAAAAAANGGAAPPDLSLMTRAREGGPAYVYSLISAGYVAPPTGLTVGPTSHYNRFFAGDLSSYWSGDPAHVPQGGFIAMPAPLAPDKVTFDDGTASTVANQARDVVAFLQWAADPKMEQRKQTGFSVMIFLFLFAGLLYASYRTIWRNIAH